MSWSMQRLLVVIVETCLLAEISNSCSKHFCLQIFMTIPHLDSKSFSQLCFFFSALCDAQSKDLKIRKGSSISTTQTAFIDTHGLKIQWEVLEIFFWEFWVRGGSWYCKKKSREYILLCFVSFLLKRFLKIILWGPVLNTT